MSPSFSRARRPLSAASVIGLAVLLVSWAAACQREPSPGAGADTTAVYEWREPGSAHGTGKFYHGREIADVLGHVGAEWLERPGRETEELPSRVVRALELRPDDVVADIGAGTGYFTFRISPHVPQGKVFAVDIDEEMLDLIRAREEELGVDNVVPIRGTITDPNLPEESVDVALIVYSYPQFSHPHEMLTNIYEGLAPGGRLVLVEYRGEDPTLPIEPIYKITEAQARRELESVGYIWRETRDILPQQHFIVFEKPMRELR